MAINILEQARAHPLPPPTFQKHACSTQQRLEAVRHANRLLAVLPHQHAEYEQLGRPINDTASPHRLQREESWRGAWSCWRRRRAPPLVSTTHAGGWESTAGPLRGRDGGKQQEMVSRGHFVSRENRGGCNWFFFFFLKKAQNRRVHVNCTC